MTTKDEEILISRVRDALDSEALDEAIVEKLSAARRNALNELDTPDASRPGSWSWTIWVPAGAVAMAFFVIALNLSTPGIPEFPYYESELQAATADELELLEDLEFVAWMLTEELSAG